MDKAINILRWFSLGFGISMLTDNLVGAVLFVVFVALNFEERDWSKIFNEFKE